MNVTRFPERPWEEGYTKEQAQYLIDDPKSIRSAFVWSSSPQGHAYWDDFRCGENLEDGARILKSWVKEEEKKKPVAVLNRKGVLLKAYFPEDRYGEDWEVIYEGDEIRMQF